MSDHRRTMHRILRSRPVVLTTALAAGLFACGEPAPDPPAFTDRGSFSGDPAVGELIAERLDAVESAPDAVEPWRGLGLAFEANGFPREAVEAYGHAAALAPDDGRTHYHLAICLEQLGELEGAVEHLATAVELGARHPPIHWRRGFIELALGRLDDAESSFDRALELRSVSQPARIGRARVALARQDAEGAMGHLEPLFTAGQGPPIAHHLMAAALRLAGRVDEAEPHLRRAGDGSEPTWPDPWQAAVDALRRGYSQSMLEGERALAEGRLGDAEKIFRQLAEQRPEDPLPPTNLAATLIASGRPQEAITLLEPLDQEASSQRFNVVMNLAAAHFTGGDPGRAKIYAERARALDPGKPRPVEMLGVILLAEGRGEEALEMLRRAVRLDPSGELTRLRLAQACEQLGHWSEAVEQYRQLVTAGGGRGDLRLRLARALVESGARSEAVEILRSLEREGVPEAVRPALEALLSRAEG